MNKQVKQLIEKHSGKVLPFKDLPVNAQCAMIHYMSVDGAAWAVEDEDLFPDWEWGEGVASLFEPELREKSLRDIEKFRPRFIQHYGEELFGIVYVPTEELIELVMASNSDLRNHHPTWESYHRWYNTHAYMNKRNITPTWPCIFSDFDECDGEVFQDGWNRFHRYVELGYEQIPCIWYTH